MATVGVGSLPTDCLITNWCYRVGPQQSIAKVIHKAEIDTYQSRPSFSHSPASQSMSPCLAIGLAWILRISILDCSLGRGISIFRSNRPGRSRAGSKVSGLRQEGFIQSFITTEVFIPYSTNAHYKEYVLPHRACKIIQSFRYSFLLFGSVMQ